MCSHCATTIATSVLPAMLNVDKKHSKVLSNKQKKWSFTFWDAGSGHTLFMLTKYHPTLK